MEPTYIPTIQIREGCAVLFDQREWDGVVNTKGFEKIRYSSTVTKGVQKRIGRAVDIFLQTTDERVVYNTVTMRDMDFRCGFVTLTISDYCEWTADKCYACLLKPFLRILKERHGVRKYVWKYELQARGNVHYHVLIDQFIAWTYITQGWNRLQHKHGLTDVYAKKYGHFNPNSTDIHKVWAVGNLSAYLMKYLQKGNELEINRNVKGKVWDCSVDLKRPRYSDVCSYANDELVRRLVASGEAKMKRLDNCTVVRCPYPEKLLTEDQKIDYCVWKYK